MAQSSMFIEQVRPMKPVAQSHLKTVGLSGMQAMASFRQGRLSQGLESIAQRSEMIGKWPTF